MQLRSLLCCVTTLIPALVLTGCGMDQTPTVVPNVDSPAISGRSFGGQQPLAGATIEVIAMGTSGYGSAGTVLATTTTDSGGNFGFAPGTYTCPQSDTPVYLLSIGGDSGSGTTNNTAAVLGAGLGPCSIAQNTFVIVNEITTTALAFTLSHFFSPTLGGSDAANDWFGGPSTTSGTNVVYSKGLVMGNNATIPTIISNATGGPVTDAGSYTVEWQKIDTIANILAACVNSAGPETPPETKTPCGKLFTYTTDGAAAAPTDTLQAAVQMALNPTAQMTNLYPLSSTTPAFDAGLTAQPNDWTIGVAYKTPALGLAVNTSTTSTLDIDSSGRIWFPSNGSGRVGAAFFDPMTQSFSGPFNTTSLADPQEVAIDANGYAWFNDSTSPVVAGYQVTGPATTQTVSLPNTTSQAVTVGGDGRIAVGITAGSKYELANISADRTGYSILSGVAFAFPVQSLASDLSDNDWVATSDPSTMTLRNVYVSGGAATVVVNANDNSGQAIFTGNDDITARSYSGTGKNNDGLCIRTLATCYNFTGNAVANTVQGLAIDGGKQLWLAESGNGGVLQIPVNYPGNPAGAGSVYLNSNGAANIPFVEFLHGSTATGGTPVTAPAPYGIGIDASGNVWMTNASCNTTGCTPGAFTLTEIIGAAYPTITPVSAQITGRNLVGTEPTQ